MARKGSVKKSKGRIKKVIKAFVFALLMALIFLGAAALGFWQRIYKETPGAKELFLYQPAETSIIYDRTGQHKLYEIHGRENRKILSHEEIPEVVRITTLAAEDDNFYQHQGFDIPSIIRAAWIDISSQEYSQGGSTITQQLARNVFLTQERTWERKIKELAIAVKIEKEFSKDKILDLYLNEIPYGSNIYGIEAAAHNFFRKNAAELTLDEAAVLAALPKATTYYSPYGRNKKELAERQKYILGRVEELGWVEKNVIEEAKSKSIKVYRPKAPVKAPHFVFYVLEELEKIYGEEKVKSGGLRIRTTLDLGLQEKAEQVILEGVQKNLSQYQAENSALVAIDPKTGQILSMVGSKDYFSSDIDGQVNVALSLRQPGSAFKPLAYARAFEKGFQPETLFYDAPTDFGPDGSGRNYRPNNYDSQFRGLVSMRQALAMSLNIPAVKTLYLAGISDTIDLAERLGITTLTRKDIYGLSLVLGGGEVNLLELTGAYAVFANDGVRAPISPILEVTDRKGKELFYLEEEFTQVVDQQVTRKINAVLSDNSARTPVFGKSSSLHVEGYQVAVKTGTTQEYRDAWTVGYTPNLAVGIWSGNNDNRPMRQGAAGIFATAPIWKQFMLEIIPTFNQKQFIAYEKVEEGNPMVIGKAEQKVIYINKKTGKEISFEEAMHMSQKKVKKKTIKTGIGRSILSQVDKDNPLNSTGPNKNDPMLKYWEAGLRKEEKKEEEE